MSYLSKLILIGLMLPASGWASGLTTNQERWIEDHLDSGELMGLAVVSINGDSIEHRAYGRISVEDPRPPSLSELLPQLEFDNPAVGRITLLELGTHTSGLPRLPSNLMMTDPADPYADYDAKALLEALRTARPDQELNKTYSYSNFGVGLLGYLLGVVDGGGYAEALRTHVLRPMGMEATTVADTESLLPGHHAGEVVSNWHLDALAGAGVLRSNATELARVFVPWLSPRPGLLVHDTATDLEIVAPGDGQMSVTRVWHTVGEGEERVYWHNGGTGGFRSFAGFNPKTGEGWVVLSNSDFEVTEFGLGLLLEPPALVLAEPAKAERDFSEYHGHFAITPEFVLSVFEQQGQLVVQATGQPALRIVAGGKDEFNLLAVDARLVFERDDSGTVQRFEEIEITATTLKEFVGSYDLAPGASFEVRVEQGQLMVQLASQPWLPVFPFEVDRFFYKAVNAQITFNREDEKVVSLTLHQNGVNQVAPKR